MNVVWVVSDDYLLDPTVDLTALKDIGSFWGGWRTWRACNTDNVVCYDRPKARELVKNKFNTTCNLYIPEAVYTELNKPPGVRAFGSEFQHEVKQADAIVSLFLAASSADLVLLLGFDLTEEDTHDVGYIHQAILSYPDVQFVLIDHPEHPVPKIAQLDNMTRDSMVAVLHMLS